jgi:hypothetical protein
MVFMWKTGFHKGQNQSAPGIQMQQGEKKVFPAIGDVVFPAVSATAEMGRVAAV